MNPAPPAAPHGKLRLSRLWIALGLAFDCFIIYMSLAPVRSPEVLVFPFSDKVMHMAVYGASMFWFGQIFRRRSVLFFIASALAAMGVVLEFLQGTTAYRSFEYEDMAANMIGVAAGLLLSRAGLGGLLSSLEAFLVRARDR